MKKIVFISFCLLISILAFSQERKNYAKNVTTSFDNSKVTISYYIPSNSSIRSYYIYLEMEGKNGERFNPREVTGSRGANIGSGAHKIIWNFSADAKTKEEAMSMKINVKAINLEEEIKHKNTIPIGCAFGIPGATTLITGIVKMVNNSKNNSDYKTYEENDNPDDLIWTELGYDSRQDLYDTINGKRKTGQILAGIATPIIVGLGTLLVVKKRKKNSEAAKARDASRASIDIYPIIRQDFSSPKPFSNSQYGLGIKVKF